MSAPDIGTLRELANDIARAELAVHHAKIDLKRGAELALADVFGTGRDELMDAKGQRSFWRGVGSRKWVVCVDFPERGSGWCGRAGEAGARAAWHFADTPRSAVNAALDALAKTHPAEAAALRAVIPEAPHG